MLNLKKEEIDAANYPVGFYKRKAEQIREIFRVLVERYDSRVPDEIEDLLKLKGVGRNTANIVITKGYNKPGVAVGTHVHRISNRLGLVSTKSLNHTEFSLGKTLPKWYWIVFNDLRVMHDKTICMPVSSKCNIYHIIEYCKRIGITHFR